jgi:chromosome segregation ATPase|tara:strand:- start:143 stop:244 length:102 start_codon:yes stop_codon:yes gene_type:complete
VVDTLKEAEACIAYLRKENIGRGNFMGIDKMIK